MIGMKTPVWPASLAANVVVFGHTHAQFDRRVAHRQVIIAGSVGMSFDGPDADWLLIDETGIHLQQAACDRAKSAVAMLATN
jgi:predicted phosphodiesterase